MPDSTLSQALREAYAGYTDVTYLTLEMIHSLLPAPLRAVCDYVDLTAGLEADAPYNPGEMVTFGRYLFDFTKPEVSPSGVVTCTLTIDNVGREIVAAIESIINSREPLVCIFREYVSSDLSAPQNNPPLTMEVLDVNADVFRVNATIGLSNFQNKRFPTQAYTSEIFPSLVS